MFGIDERSILWEQDVAFPRWAWVYRDPSGSFSGFIDRLKQATKHDGLDIEFVMMYGSEIGSPHKPPTGAYGCDTVIMGDIARRASYQRSSGRLKDFHSCTRWKRISVNKDQLESIARPKAYRAMLRMQNNLLNEAETKPEDGVSEEGLSSCRS